MLRATSRFFAAVICTLVFASLSFAAVPITFNYQGYLKDSTSGEPISKEVTITFSLYIKETDEIPVWKETQLVTPVNGIYSVKLGTDTVNYPLDPATITDQLYLGITVEPDLEMTPRQMLTSSPFAIRAAVADSVATGAVGNNAISGVIERTKLDLYGVVSRSGDTMTGALTIPGDGSGLRTSGLNQLAIRDGKLGIGTMFPSEQIEITGNLMLPATSTDGLSGRIISGGSTLIHNYGAQNFFSGASSGNLTMTGSDNTITGYRAFSGNSSGESNSAFGSFALNFNETGSFNTVGGKNALSANMSGNYNTALGASAGAASGFSNTSGSNNTFIGALSGPGTFAPINNATAIGYNAQVSQSDSLVLGSASVKVGIGTSAPTEKLEVVGNAKISGTLTPGSLNLPLNSLTVGTDQLTVSGNNVGIGTSTPEAKLDVVGNAAITGPLTAGSLTLPADSLTVGTNQLKLSGGMVGIGTTPTTAKLQVTNSGPSGQTALFQNTNPSNGLPTVYATTVSSGDAVYGLAQGTGKAGHFQILNPGSSASALVAETNSLTGNAAEILGKMRVTGPIASTVIGTAPFTVASNTEVTNLNANLLNGKLASEIISAASDEVRTPISACGATISTSGSYYVTQNLSTTGTCITVTASNVTLDLMGFTLSGGGLNYGISISSGISIGNIEIKNGTITNFQQGILIANIHPNFLRVINMRTIANTETGIHLGFGKNHLIKDCLSINNGGNGILSGEGTLVLNNAVYNNGGSGINSQTGSKIIGNIVKGNNTTNTLNQGGVVAFSGVSVKDNTLVGNSIDNIIVNGSKNIIEENLLADSTNGIFFIISGNFYMNNRAVGNVIDYNLNSTTQTNGGGNISF